MKRPFLLLPFLLSTLHAETIPGIELATGIPVVYRLRADSTVESKQVLES